MKQCRRCLRNLEQSEFYKHSQMADGHLNFCKQCTKDRVARYREANLDAVRDYDRVRGRTDKRKAKARNYSKTNKDKMSAYKREWAKRNRHKLRAHLRVRRAVMSGVLIKQPCEVCGDPDVEGHHPDYSKPLQVIWLCDKHHKEVHRKYDPLILDKSLL